ncbi:MAG: IS200/IS605 family transposase [Bacteroidetes bacterium]|nr:MAG: IS200/IS605 family transposase [Bacteroidota bacterium]
MPQSHTEIWIHLVWSTKNKLKLISNEWKWKLIDKFHEIANEKEYYLDFINSMPDHVHLLIKLHPSHILQDVVKNYKGLTYKWVNENSLSQEHFHWQDGYGAFSVSPQNVNKVRNYIKNQEKHHKTMTLEDEMNMLNKSSTVESSKRILLI